MRHRIFGKKGEKSTANKDTKPEDSKSKRPRGQQPGSEGHGLTEHPNLPVEEEKVIFSETPTCPECGKPYISDEDGIKESIRYEINVKAHVRKVIDHHLWWWSMTDDLVGPIIKNGRNFRGLDLVGKDRELLLSLSDSAFMISGVANKIIRKSRNRRINSQNW